MQGLAPYIAGGLAAALMAEYMAVPSGGPAEWLSASSPELTVVYRSYKVDRVTPARAATGRRPAIAAVEVVGLSNAAVVYRDRDGRVLFRTDPVTNATVVAKDVTLPEVTIRDSGNSAVKPLRIEVPAPAKAKLPPGCDSAFSPLTMPSLSHAPSRCLARNEAGSRLATLMR